LGHDFGQFTQRQGRCCKHISFDVLSHVDAILLFLQRIASSISHALLKP
jgi:histidinol phosphatase-like PHP family hydrolase